MSPIGTFRKCHLRRENSTSQTSIGSAQCSSFVGAGHGDEGEVFVRLRRPAGGKKLEAPTFYFFWTAVWETQSALSSPPEGRLQRCLRTPPKVSIPMRSRSGESDANFCAIVTPPALTMLLSVSSVPREAHASTIGHHRGNDQGDDNNSQG